MSVALTFVAPPPGLAPLVDFVLRPLDGAAGLFALEAAADAGRRLFVLDASVYLPHYQPVISDEDVAVLGLRGPEEAMVLVVANPGQAGTTVNLMAPVVVNTATGASAQVILEGQDWPLRADLAPLAG
ncbi:flagellar assembly protein FliW [Arthrobacter sp. I2-34]|uniref:Flagellar assembly protein FliW n=1 Tax=Arthrobacter hankyongi TaxID=2904801 RepID=A0ABS9L4Z3_9MICC|nr:flagellar assembly protein FliW [Arthrobacter hankyongi]MCG2621618.1 flagellar assembly protein FliW [Arthrobacter hankyongi]